MDIWIEIIIKVLAGLVIVIPLVIELVKYVQKAAKEKNWGSIVALTLKYMTAAETLFSDGAMRKDWVIAMVRTSAQSIEYELTDAAIAKISEMIDNICAASKIINNKATEPEKPLPITEAITSAPAEEPIVIGQGTFDE